MRRALLVGVAVALLGVAAATTYLALTLDEMLERAELAFHGRVLERSTEARDGEPWTLVTFEVLSSWRGSQGGEVTLGFYGGALEDGVSVAVTGMPELAVGDEVIVLAYDAPYYSPVVGFNQGLWRLTAQGFARESGELLSLSEAGELTLDGDGAATDELLAALRSRLEAQP
jgi:hypothetical protein